MIRIRFPEPDRGVYGLPEWIDFDWSRPRLRELRELRAQLGMSWQQLVDQAHGDDHDEQVAATGIVYWLAAIRAGAKVSWTDFDVDFLGVDFEQVPDPDPNPAAPTSGA